MPKIKYIFRDFRKTLVKLDDRKSYMAHIMRAYKLPKEVLVKALSKSMGKFIKGEISEDKLRKDFAKNLGLPLHKNCTKIFHMEIDSIAVLYKSIINLVRKLQKLGYHNVILSDENMPEGDKIRKIGRYDDFEDVVLSHEIGLSKYDDVVNGTSKIFRYVLKKYGLKPSEAIFIDDREANCISAQKLGIKTIIAKNPRQTIRDLKKLLKLS